MRTRHLVSLVTGILIFSVLVPVCLSIWLAHRQAEDKFVDALDSYASRVLIRSRQSALRRQNRRSRTYRHSTPHPALPRIYAKCVGLNSHGAIFRK